MISPSSLTRRQKRDLGMSMCITEDIPLLVATTGSLGMQEQLEAPSCSVLFSQYT